MTRANDRLSLSMSWWRWSGTMMVCLWLVGFLVFPLLSAAMHGQVLDSRSLGLGASFGLVIVLFAWVAVLIAIACWMVLVRYVPRLDDSYVAIVIFAVVISGLALREQITNVPMSMSAALGVLGFVVPRLLVKRLRRGCLATR